MMYSVGTELLVEGGAHNCRQRDGFPHSQGTELVAKASVVSGEAGLGAMGGDARGGDNGFRSHERLPTVILTT